MSRTAALLSLLAAALAVTASGCGTDEKSGKVGDTLSVDHVSVTLQRADTSVPVPANDVTGLSRPAPGSTLFGARVKVCTHGEGAVVPTDFGVTLQGGGHGRLKYPERNYPHGYDAVRDGCGSGWLVFDVPQGSAVDKLTFAFVNTGSSNHMGGGQDEVDVRFTWAVGPS